MSDTPQSPEERLRALFARAAVKVRETGFASYPPVRNAFGGVLSPDGCTIVASRDFEWEALACLAEAIQNQAEMVIIFPESFMEKMTEQASRWVINGVSAATVSREDVLAYAVCVVKHHAVVFIDWTPSSRGEGALVVPRSAAEMIIYGNVRP